MQISELCHLTDSFSQSEDAYLRLLLSLAKSECELLELRLRLQMLGEGLQTLLCGLSLLHIDPDALNVLDL